MTANVAQLRFAGQALLSTNPEELKAVLAEAGTAIPESVRLAESLGGTPLELEKEYVRLFLNPAGAPCPPWQSAHEDEEGRLMGAAHHSAASWYQNYGVEACSATEPADHAGLLLLFFAELVEGGAEAPELERFAARHLAWIPAFAGKVAQQTRHPFYAGLSRMLTESLAQVSA